MRVAVYGGSFDPLHIGHLAILRHLSLSPEFDEVRMIVSPLNPLKEASRQDAERRLEKAREAVLSYPELRVTVDDIEFDMPSPHYTSATLDELSARYPDREFVFVIGADNLAEIRKWHGYRHILFDYGVLVFPREGFDPEALREELWAENPFYMIEIADAEFVNVSSTQIREAEDKGEDISSLVAL